MIDAIHNIDTQILELVRERCRILSDSKGDLRTAVTEVLAVGVRSDFERRLLKYIAGETRLQTAQQNSIAYLGPEFSYSYSAAAKYFGPIESLQAVSTIAAVFEEIVRGQSRYGVVPIENSTDGRIVDTLNMFIRSPIRICGEVLLPIHHNLLAMCNRNEIRDVYSKPQALSQCRAWLTSHLPNARWVEVASTAAAAKIAATTPYAAAVASREAGVFLGLDIIAASIEDNPNNVTRFAVIGNQDVEPTRDDKTSLMFQVPHVPGALADVMVLLRDNGLNLTWIESFPVPGSGNEYFFFVEFEGHQAHPNAKKAIDQLRKQALRLDVLGSYPRATLTT